MSFEELLKQAGLQDYSQYFSSDTGNIASELGFKGFQAQEFRKMAGQSLQDLMQKREQGLYGIEQQRGTEMAGLTSQLQSYLQNTFARGERISGLDPYNKDYIVEQNKEFMDRFRSLPGFANQFKTNLDRKRN